MSDPFGLATIARPAKAGGDEKDSKVDLQSAPADEAENLFGLNHTSKKKKGKDKKEKERERKKFLEDLSTDLSASTIVTNVSNSKAPSSVQSKDEEDKCNNEETSSKVPKNLKEEKQFEKEIAEKDKRVCSDAIALLDSLALESENEQETVLSDEEQHEDELIAMFRRKKEENLSLRKQSDAPLFDDEDETLGSAAFYCEDEENKGDSAIGILLEDEIRRRKEKSERKKNEELNEVKERKKSAGIEKEVGKEGQAEDNETVQDIFEDSKGKGLDQGKIITKQKKFRETSLFEDNDETGGLEEEDSFENIISKVRSHKCQQKFRVQRVLKTKKVSIPNHREIVKKEKQKLLDNENTAEKSMKTRAIRPTTNVPVPNWSTSGGTAGPRATMKKSGKGFTPFTSFIEQQHDREEERRLRKEREAERERERLAEMKAEEERLKVERERHLLRPKLPKKTKARQENEDSSSSSNDDSESQDSDIDSDNEYVAYDDFVSPDVLDTIVRPVDIYGSKGGIPGRTANLTTESMTQSNFGGFPDSMPPVATDGDGKSFFDSTKNELHIGTVSTTSTFRPAFVDHLHDGFFTCRMFGATEAIDAISGSPYTEYVIQCQWGMSRHDMKPWIVARRFREFVSLDTVLRTKFPHLAGRFRDLPAHDIFSTFSNMAPDVIQRRQEGLHEYLSVLIMTMPDVLRCSSFDLFLHITDRVQKIRQEIAFSNSNDASSFGRPYEEMDYGNENENESNVDNANNDEDEFGFEEDEKPISKNNKVRKPAYPPGQLRDTTNLKLPDMIYSVEVNKFSSEYAQFYYENYKTEPITKTDLNDFENIYQNLRKSRAKLDTSGDFMRGQYLQSLMIFIIEGWPKLKYITNHLNFDDYRYKDLIPRVLELDEDLQNLTNEIRDIMLLQYGVPMQLDEDPLSSKGNSTSAYTSPNLRVSKGNTHLFSEAPLAKNDDEVDEFDFEDKEASSSASSPSGYADQQESSIDYNEYIRTNKPKHHSFGQYEYEEEDCFANI